MPLVLRRVGKHKRRGPFVQSSNDTFGFPCDETTSNLGTRMIHTIGLVVCEVTFHSCAKLASGIDEAFDHRGWVAFVAAVLSHHDLCALGKMPGLSDLSLTPRGGIAVSCCLTTSPMARCIGQR
jgi:hypothetical protein